MLYVDKEIDNLVTSPAYVVFRTSMDPSLLVQIIKQPFMKYQIQILSSGSIRDNFSAEKLKLLKIPNLTEVQENELRETIDNTIKKLKKLQMEQSRQFDNLNGLLNRETYRKLKKV